MSRVNDGICDCCDGADEPKSKQCPDICELVLREERERQRLLKENFAKGYARRQKELQAYQEMLTTAQEELDAVTVEHTSLQSQIDSVEKDIEQLKHDNLRQRIQALRDTIMSLSHESESTDDAPLKGLLEPLSEEGLVTVIVQACQLAGEQQGSFEEHSSTCVPLRLAGLDVGIVWGEEDYKEGTVTEERLHSTSNEWQDVIDRNAAGEIVWSVNDDKKNTSRRRLTEEEHYDDDVAYEEHWDEEDYPEEDYLDHYDDYDEEIKAVDDEAEEMNQELLDGVKAYAFSAARLSFLNRASHLITKIDDLMKVTDEDEEQGDDRLNAPKVDPMAIQAVRNTLKRRKESIERGFKYAVSAQILVKPVESSHQDLVALAAGTLYHGMIRSSDLWQILAYMTVQFPSHACFSPWSILCPPQVSDHNGNPFPPLPIVEAVKHYCEEGPHSDASIICDTNVDEEIPSSIHDHYYGYTVIEPRNDDDVLSKAFARLDNVVNRSEIVKLEEKRDELKGKLESLSSRMRELEEQMGGRDHSKYGSQGELYSLRDSCHSVQEGKYEYEICIFGRATQKAHGNKSGTQLGRWSGIKVDEETGMRTMEWTRGAQCWNGPERSATVHVTCGAENKVLSAEEPDTCRYVLEMESYVACDDEYKERHGL